MHTQFKEDRAWIDPGAQNGG